MSIYIQLKDFKMNNLWPPTALLLLRSFNIMFSKNTHIGNRHSKQSFSVVVGRCQCLGLFELFMNSANFICDFMCAINVCVRSHSSHNHLTEIEIGYWCDVNQNIPYQPMKDLEGANFINFMQFFGNFCELVYFGQPKIPCIGY